MRVQILNGHGGWAIEKLTFIVPQPLKIHFLCNHGDEAHDTKEVNDIITLKNKQGKRAEIVQAFRDKNLIKETVSEGEQCFNYTLYYLERLTGFQSNFVVQMKKGKHGKDLKELTVEALKDNNTDIIFYACRSFIGKKTRLYGCYSASQFHVINNCISNIHQATSQAAQMAEILEKCLMMDL